MEKSFEAILLEELESTYNENDVTLKQERIMNIMDAIKTYTRELNSGRYRSDGYGKIFVTYLKNFTVSILFGDTRNNGSGCLVKLNKDFLITNAHVVKAALQTEFLLIGEVEVEVKDFEQRIVSIDDNLDLAVIDLSDGLNDELEETGKMFFKPETWPESNCEVGDQLFLVGFPGTFREDEDMYSSVFYTAIHEEIMDITDRRILVSFNRENWVKALGEKEIDELNHLGGFSGGPVFIFRDDKPELVGFVFEEVGGFMDGVQIIKSNMITADGVIGINTQ
ncbi:S1 family peptidase [Planomicrobium okeanokoites]|uniref:S1 family peptidase n=1 Tax=Planomicrobium okeanokoites TaxID=244 RepID=UPI0009FCD245|nr:serine protease [Planomicrobium okeanokoites]